MSAIAPGAPRVVWPPPREPAPAAVPGEPPPSPTYYELPVVKPAPWRWFIPAYFFAGGTAGAAATLAPFAELRGDLRLARRLHWIATLGEAAGSALLVADLGRPARFHHMLRVFRPTSPMNLGTWILSAAGATGGLALLGSLRGRLGPSLASLGAAVAGSLLATYTGVLIGNTALPIWAATRHRLPPWFAASSAAGLASLLELIGPRPPRGYGAVAKLGELIAARAVERGAEAKGVAAPLRDGGSGRLWRASRWLGAASLAATLLPALARDDHRHRHLRPLAGALGTAAAICARFAIVHAGRASAADPRATFEPQREAQRESQREAQRDRL